MKLGILGDGQLALLMVQTFKKLQLNGMIDSNDEIWVLSPLGDKCPAHAAGAQIFTGSWNKSEDIEAFVNSCKIDRLTAEMTHFDLKAIRKLEDIRMLEAIRESDKAESSLLTPTVKTFHLIQDKFEQKSRLYNGGIPIADSVEIQDILDIDNILQTLGGYPIMLKTRGPARDGKGVIQITSHEEYSAAINKWQGSSLYAEKWQPAVKELSVIIIVGAKDGVAYPITESIQKNNTCYITETPANIDPYLAKQARDLASRAAAQFDGVGTYVVDLFLTSEDKLLVNGVTPRLDNSCHYTINGCVTSAYANHIFAVMGKELGKPDLLADKHVIMVNLLGLANGEEGKILAAEQMQKAKSLGGFVVDYGKEVKLERKIGHIVFAADSQQEARLLLKSYDVEAYKLLPPSHEPYLPAFANQEDYDFAQLFEDEKPSLTKNAPNYNV